MLSNCETQIYVPNRHNYRIKKVFDFAGPSIDLNEMGPISVFFSISLDTIWNTKDIGYMEQILHKRASIDRMIIDFFFLYCSRD